MLDAPFYFHIVSGRRIWYVRKEALLKCRLPIIGKPEITSRMENII